MRPLLFVLALCVAQICARPNFDYDYGDPSGEDKKPWRPEPLKPAPWQLDNESGEDATPPQAPPVPPVPQSAHEAVVQVPGVGEIAGVRGFKTIANRPVNAFLGLRYGKVGSGLARFQAAQPSGYQGRIRAQAKSPNCPQFPEVDRLKEAEARGENVDDCLTLDIYAPEFASNLPVLVFVHGEMLFDGGSEEAQPDYVLEKDVLLVSINYRLAPFGFLSALSEELPGNVALSDLHLALEWLQRNLEHFGGDPGQVTLVGQAGGATLAHALSLSGRATNLFQRLILQSGTALNPYLIDERPLDTLETFSKVARCPPVANSPSLSAFYACLGRLPTSQLASAFQQLLEQNEPRGRSFIGGFKLVVGDALGYLPKSPVALAANASNALPMIVGAAKDASAFILSRFYDQIAGLRSNNVTDYIDVVLRHTAPPSEHQVWKQWALREIFTPDQVHTATPRSVSQGLLELSNLILYRAPVIFTIRNSYRTAPTYLYTFDYRGGYHRFGHFSNPLPFGVDASLSDDSVYLFPYPPEASRLNPEDRSLSRALVTMWVDFATTGVPNPNSGVWPRASSEYGPFLRFTNSKENPLELDPHFGEGIPVPNLNAEYFNATTTTTTTTTQRPYVYQYGNWQPQQPQQWPQQPQQWPQQPQQPPQQPQQPPQQPQQPPQQPRPQYQQAAREQQLRQQEQRRREQELREQQRKEYEKHLLEQQEQLMREKLERDQLRREQQQQREQQQREQQQREQQRREQQRREQQWLEQQQREQQEREGQENRRQPYPSYERQQPPQRPPQYPNVNAGSQLPGQEQDQQREQQWREQQQRDQQRREQQQREQQQREQQWREQQQREQQQREEQEREEQEREALHQEQQSEDEDGHQPYPSYDDHQAAQEQEAARRDQELQERQREQQRREQLQQEQQQREWEQQERERQNAAQDSDGSNDDAQLGQPSSNPEYDPNYDEEQEREERRREQLQREREREQQEREREQQPEINHDPIAYPSYEDYLKAHQESDPAESERDSAFDEEQVREQLRRDQLHEEQAGNNQP
ncbi:hypothetical protein KR018_009433, partial [Drosophila ironensis]